MEIVLAAVMGTTVQRCSRLSGDCGTAVVECAKVARYVQEGVAVEITSRDTPYQIYSGREYDVADAMKERRLL